MKVSGQIPVLLPLERRQQVHVFQVSLAVRQRSQLYHVFLSFFLWVQVLLPFKLLCTTDILFHNVFHFLVLLILLICIQFPQSLLSVMIFEFFHLLYLSPLLAFQVPFPLLSCIDIYLPSFNIPLILHTYSAQFPSCQDFFFSFSPLCPVFTLLPFLL
jgi:hypothetical protein